MSRPDTGATRTEGFTGFFAFEPFFGFGSPKWKTVPPPFTPESSPVRYTKTVQADSRREFGSVEGVGTS